MSLCKDIGMNNPRHWTMTSRKRNLWWQAVTRGSPIFRNTPFSKGNMSWENDRLISSIPIYGKMSSADNGNVSHYQENVVLWRCPETGVPWGTPKSLLFSWHVPWNKPSYWATPMTKALMGRWSFLFSASLDMWPSLAPGVIKKLVGVSI